MVLSNRLLGIAIIIAVPSIAAQQTSVPRKVQAAADRISAVRIFHDVEYMSSDALGGRDTFSPGLDSAAEYIVRRLRRAGLKPLGDDGTFLQHYNVRTVTADTTAMYLTANGKRFGFGGVLIAGCNNGVSASAPVVYVGHGWSIPSLKIDAYAGVDVRGKLVVRSDAFPAGLTPDAIPGDAEIPRVAARRLGALAVLIVPRSPENIDDFFRREAWRSSDLEATQTSASGQCSPALLIQPAVTRAIFGEDTARASAVLEGKVLAPFQLAGNTTLVIPATERRRSRYNIVAVIPGADPVLKNEYITFGAHLDGVRGPGVGADTIYNAADDNASGSAAILAVAEQLMRAPRPRRSIAFIWSTGHEIGLWGTRSFVAKQVVPTARIVAHLNLDMVGVSRAPGSPDSASTDASEPHEVFVTGPRVISTELDSLVERTNRGYLQMRLNHRYDTPDSEFIFPRTDARPFVERGVPLIALFTGFHPRYHRPQDEAKYLDPKKIEEVSRTALVIAWTLADALHTPRIDKGYPARVPRFR